MGLSVEVEVWVVCNPGVDYIPPATNGILIVNKTARYLTAVCDDSASADCNRYKLASYLTTTIGVTLSHSRFECNESGTTGLTLPSEPSCELT